MTICPAITRKGTRCTQTVEGAHAPYCHHHDPARAHVRRLNASRAGRAKANPLVQALHRQLEQLGDDVANGELVPYRGAVVVQAINARIRLLEVERRVRETEELEERLAALEQGRGVGRWGA